jgi:hypothetical protein
LTNENINDDDNYPAEDVAKSKGLGGAMHTCSDSSGQGFVWIRGPPSTMGVG